MTERDGEIMLDESEEQIEARWERTKPLAGKLIELSDIDPEDQAGYDEIVDHLVENPKDAFQLIYQVMEQYPKPSDPETAFNTMPVSKVADLMAKMAERIK